VVRTLRENAFPPPPGAGGTTGARLER
jgi:hypothetical protein